MFTGLQPLFPGESGVDQLVEIIKVCYLVTHCFSSLAAILLFCIPSVILFFIFGYATH